MESATVLNDNVRRINMDESHGIQEFQLYALLPNGQRVPGLRVVIKSRQGATEGTQAYFNLLVNCGSRNENLDQLGGAHLLEHACFLGLGPDADPDVVDYFWAVQGARDNFNAFTTVNAINYSAETEVEHYEELLRTFSQMLSGANLANLKNNSTFQQEKQNVVSEDHRNKAAAASARRTLTTATCMVNEALGLHNAQPTIGQEAVYTAMTPQDLRNLHRQCFCPSRATLIVCGLQDDTGQFLHMVYNTLGQIPINEDKSPLQSPSPTMRDDMRVGERMKLIQSGNAATYIAFATAYPDMVQGKPIDIRTSYTKRLALEVMHELLLPSTAPSTGLLGPWYQHNYIYDAQIMPAQSGYASPTVLLVAVPADKASEAVRVMEVQKAVRDSLSICLGNFQKLENADKLLQAAKQRLINQDKNMKRGSLRGISEALLQGVRYRNASYFFNRAQHVQGVTARDIEDVAKTVWAPNRTSIVVHSQFGLVGPADVREDFGKDVLTYIKPPAAFKRNEYTYSQNPIRPSLLLASCLRELKNNVLQCTTRVRPQNITEYCVSFANLAQTQDNHEEIIVLCKYINECVNAQLQALVPHEAMAQVFAHPTAAALHFFIRADQAYARAVAQQTMRYLESVPAKTCVTQLRNLIGTQGAIYRGAMKTDAHSIAHASLSQRLFVNQVPGITSETYEERMDKLNAATFTRNVVKHLQNMTRQGEASCAHVLNDVELSVLPAASASSSYGNGIVAYNKTPEDVLESPSAAPSSAEKHGIDKFLRETFKLSHDTPEFTRDDPVKMNDLTSANFVAADIANTPEIVHHMWVVLPGLKVQKYRDDHETRACFHVLRSMIGDGFGGRLMKYLRAVKGLTYGTTFSLPSDLTASDAPVLLQMTATFKPPEFLEGVACMEEVIHKALFGPKSVTSQYAEKEFNLALERWKTLQRRASGTLSNCRQVCLEQNMYHSSPKQAQFYASYSELCDLEQTQKSRLTFSTFQNVIQKVLPQTFFVVQAAVGDGAVKLVQQYKKTQTAPRVQRPVVPAASMLRTRDDTVWRVKLRL